MSMSELLAQSGGNADGAGTMLRFLSLGTLHEACNATPQSRDINVSVEQGFPAITDTLKLVFDPMTQPLSWMLEDALSAFTTSRQN